MPSKWRFAGSREGRLLSWVFRTRWACVSLEGNKERGEDDYAEEADWAGAPRNILTCSGNSCSVLFDGEMSSVTKERILENSSRPKLPKNAFKMPKKWKCILCGTRSHRVFLKKNICIRSSWPRPWPQLWISRPGWPRRRAESKEEQVHLGGKYVAKQRSPVRSPQFGERCSCKANLRLHLVKLVNIFLSLCHWHCIQQTFLQVSDTLCSPDDTIWWQRGDSSGMKGRDVGDGADSPGLTGRGESAPWGWPCGILALTVS